MWPASETPPVSFTRFMLVDAKGSVLYAIVSLLSDLSPLFSFFSPFAHGECHD